jgi:hypothetical protein
MTWPQCLGTSGTAIIVIAAATIFIVTSAVTFWLARRSLPQAKRLRTVDGDLHTPDAPSHPSRCGASAGLDIWALRPRSWKNDRSLIFAVQQWADERVQRTPGAELRAMLAFEDFSQWCGGQGLRPCAVAAFGRALTLVVESWGCRKVRKRSAAYYQGCRLTSNPS